MTYLKELLVGAAALCIFAADAGAQIVRDDHMLPPPANPAEAKNLPPQSPAAPASAGAIVIKYKVEMLDKDRDGLVSRAEVANEPDLLKVFDKLDRNRDGKLSESELSVYTK